MSEKERLSVTVDAELLAAGRTAVTDGRADSLSAWVNEALARQVDHDRRTRAFDEFLAAFEAEHGEITEEEMRETTRRLRAEAIVVRSGRSGRVT
ncbi:MAG: CopG family transcriptional regulator [Egibacteraceae bacterium]